MAKIVLVADDHPLIRKCVCRILEDGNDYRVFGEAANGAELVSFATKCNSDLVILDLQMPIINGAEAARQLKKLLPNIPIILFTHLSDEANRLTIEELPVDRIISKSDASDLMAHVLALAPPENGVELK